MPRGHSSRAESVHRERDGARLRALAESVASMGPAGPHTTTSAALPGWPSVLLVQTRMLAVGGTHCKPDQYLYQVQWRMPGWPAWPCVRPSCGCWLRNAAVDNGRGAQRAAGQECGPGASLAVPSLYTQRQLTQDAARGPHAAPEHVFARLFCGSRPHALPPAPPAALAGRPAGGQRRIGLRGRRGPAAGVAGAAAGGGGGALPSAQHRCVRPVDAPGRPQLPGTRPFCMSPVRRLDPWPRP